MLIAPHLLFPLITSTLFLVAVADIDTLEQLYNAVLTGPNQKVGFLSEGNFLAVKNTLPSNVQPVYVSSEAILTANIQNQTYVAGLLTQTPPSGFNHIFSGILSTQSMMLRANASTLLRQVIGKILYYHFP